MTQTHKELERLWRERAIVPWGMPATEFDEKLALLLVDDDDDDELAEYDSAGNIIDQCEYVPNDEDVLLSDTEVCRY